MATHHSSGPWNLIKTNEGAHEIWNQDWRVVTVPHYGPDHMVECHANARLIAAAPDLLEALELAAQYVGKGMAENAYEGTALPAENALRTINAAIEKAN